MFCIIKFLMLMEFYTEKNFSYHHLNCVLSSLRSLGRCWKTQMNLVYLLWQKLDGMDKEQNDTFSLEKI